MTLESPRKTWLLKPPATKRYLSDLLYQHENTLPTGSMLEQAIRMLEHLALKGEECPVFTRVGTRPGRIFLDLADDRGRVVKITPGGWTVLNKCNVRFRRPRGMFPLPVPEQGGTIKELKQFVNYANGDDWRLLVGWLVHALSPKGPYTVLCLHGEKGSAKTTTGRILRALVDPHDEESQLQSEPKDRQDLIIAAHNAWVVAFDNLSSLSPKMSNDLCRLATGSVFQKRKLFSDSDEVRYSLKRPVILTAIEEVTTTRADLTQRALVLNLPKIEDIERQTEWELWEGFNAARPRILGALLNAVATGLKNLPTTKLKTSHAWPTSSSGSWLASLLWAGRPESLWTLTIAGLAMPTSQS
jgi:hypothetical protein